MVKKMKIYIDCSKILSNKIATRLDCYINDNLIFQSVLNAEEFNHFSIECEVGTKIRLSFSSILREKCFEKQLLQKCSYKEFEKKYCIDLPKRFYSNVEKGRNINAFDSINFVREWVYAYDTVIENNSLDETVVVLSFTDKYIFDEVQTADVFFTNQDFSLPINLVRKFSIFQVEQQYRKKQFFYFFRYGITILCAICLTLLLGALYYALFPTNANGAPEGLILMIFLVYLGYIRWNHTNIRKAKVRIEETATYVILESVRSKEVVKKSLPRFCMYLDYVDKKMKQNKKV